MEATSYHHGDLRNALLREGRTLLEERGPAELSLREVARRTGVSVAAPSKHFEGKEALLAAIASEGFRELASERERISATNERTLDRARAMLLSYVDYAKANKGVFYLMVGPRIIDTYRHGELADISARSFNMFSDTVMQLAREHGWPDEELDLVAHSAWAMEHGLATLILGDRVPRPQSRIDLRQMIEFSINMLLSAVVAGPQALRQVMAAAPERAKAPKAHAAPRRTPAQATRSARR
jgi:AcrR family transcriptional regulator